MQKKSYVSFSYCMHRSTSFTQSLFEEKQRIRKTELVATVPSNNNTINIHLILQKDARCTLRQLAQMTNIFVCTCLWYFERKKWTLRGYPNCLAMNNWELALKNAKINKIIIKIFDYCYGTFEDCSS